MASGRRFVEEFYELDYGDEIEDQVDRSEGEEGGDKGQKEKAPIGTLC